MGIQRLIRAASAQNIGSIPVGVMFVAVFVAVFVVSLGGDSGRAGADSDASLFSATSHRRFNDVDHWVKVFDDPKRDAWQRPADVINSLGLQPGMRVADLGAGTGYFSGYLSRAVGDSGTVFAVETEPALVEYLRERAETEGLSNVIPVLTSFGTPRLPAGTIDLLFIVDTFHHIDDRLDYFADVVETLSPNGRVAILDWKKEKLPVGPAPDHKLAREQVVREMEQARYQLVNEFRELPYQYLLVFRPQPRPGD